MRLLLALLLGLLMLAGTVIADAAGLPPLTRAFKSFAVTCSNFAGFCAARADDLAYMSEKHRLVVGRHHDARATWWIGFDVGPGRLDATKPLTVTVDAAAPVTVPAGSGWRLASHPGFATLQDGTVATALLAAMAKGEKIALKGTAPEQTPYEREFSLSGLMAAKGWIDERQKREKSPLAAGPAPLEPIDAATEKRWAEQREGPFPKPVLAAYRALSDRAAKDDRYYDCDKLQPSEEDPETVAPGVAAMRLGPNTALIVVECTWHVYQGTAVVFLAEGPDLGRVMPLGLPQRSKAGLKPSPLPYVNEWAFDPLFRGLSEHSRGRGNDDCGTDHLWRFDGKAMRLVEERSKLCPVNGKTNDDAEATDEEPYYVFPVVWQEKAERR